MIRNIADLQAMKEAYQEKIGQYDYLALVCYGTGCVSSGCKAVRDAMVEELEAFGLSDRVAVIERGCMGTCAVGPVVYILPDETYYTEMTPERVKDVVNKHFIGGEPVNEYTFYDSVQKKRVANIKDVAFFRDQVRIALRNNIAFHSTSMRSSLLIISLLDNLSITLHSSNSPCSVIKFSTIFPMQSLE